MNKCIKFLKEIKIHEKKVNKNKRQNFGLIITKLDSEARAGVSLSICKKFNLPIIAVGVGEKDSDLRQFNASEFTKLMLEN